MDYVSGWIGPEARESDCDGPGDVSGRVRTSQIDKAENRSICEIEAQYFRHIIVKNACALFVSGSAAAVRDRCIRFRQTNRIIGAHGRNIDDMYGGGRTRRRKRKYEKGRKSG